MRESMVLSASAKHTFEKQEMYPKKLKPNIIIINFSQLKSRGPDRAASLPDLTGFNAKRFPTGLKYWDEIFEKMSNLEIILLGEKVVWNSDTV